MPPEAFQVALFLRDGARAVFLQDADPCALAPDKLAAVIEHVRRAFPRVTRVTTYGRAATLARRRPPQLALLAAAGLTRVHLGMESGSDEVLARVDKGCTAAQLVTAGRRVLEARHGAVLLRHAGARRARACRPSTSAAPRPCCARSRPPPRRQRPLVVRLRTTAVVPGTPLADDEAAGRFALPDDVEVAAELRALLEALDGVRLELRSDHALNLMSGLEGSLPDDRDRLIGLLDEFLALPAADQAEFALGARVGVYRAPRDLRDEQRRAGACAGASPAPTKRPGPTSSKPPSASARGSSEGARADGRALAPPASSAAGAGVDLAGEVALDGRPDGRGERVDVGRRQRLDPADVAHEREADELRAGQRRPQLGVGHAQGRGDRPEDLLDEQAPDELAPPARCDTTERSMARKIGRLCGSSHTVRNCRVTSSPMRARSPARIGGRKAAGEIGSSTAASKSCSLVPK